MKLQLVAGLLPAQFPCLRIFPRYVSRMVKVKKQPLAAIEKSQPDEVVVDECRQRPQNYVDHAEIAVAFVHSQLRAQ